MRFNIGDTVYWASYQHKAQHIPCPDCGGTKRVRVILYDNEEVSIECATCSHGYNPPKGTIVVYEYSKDAKKGTITGVEIREDGTQWRISQGYIVKDSEVFPTREAALARAEETAVHANAEEQRRISDKERPTRTWAWNASYHRREIKECERRITYHKAKLAVADARTKVSP